MTIEELKAVYGAMTPGTFKPWDTMTGGRHIGVIPPKEPEFHLRDFVASWLKEADAIGLSALHNHFPEIMERYEAMRKALEAMSEVAELADPVECFGWRPTVAGVRTALTNANAPLTTTKGG